MSTRKGDFCVSLRCVLYEFCGGDCFKLFQSRRFKTELRYHQVSFISLILGGPSSSLKQGIVVSIDSGLRSWDLMHLFFSHLFGSGGRSNCCPPKENLLFSYKGDCLFSGTGYGV